VQQHQREFAEFYAATRDDCLRVVLMTAGDLLLAEDLVAEAYTRAWLSWRKVRGLDQPRAWVVRTALNTRISWWRRRRREVGLDGQDYEHASPASQDGTYQRGLDTDLVAALRRLPVRQREVVALRLLLDLDTASTAEALCVVTRAAHLMSCAGNSTSGTMIGFGKSSVGVLLISVHVCVVHFVTPI